MSSRPRALGTLSALALCATACTPGSPHVVAVQRAFVVPGAGLAPGVLYATMVNPTEVPDTLTAIETAAAASVQVHGASMQMLERFVAPAGASVRLAPGGTHGMVMGLHAGLRSGDSVSVTFHFAHAGALAVYARVIGYAQVDSAVMSGGR